MIILGIGLVIAGSYAVGWSFGYRTAKNEEIQNLNKLKTNFKQALLRDLYGKRI